MPAVSGPNTPDPEAVARQIEILWRVARATPEPSVELARAGEALKDLTRWVLTVDSSDPRLAGAAREIERLAGELGAAGAPATRYLDGVSELPEERLPNARGTHPLLGSTHPLAPPIALRVEGDRVLGDVNFDVRFEGNVGWVHGGFVAAGFDIVAVQASRLSGRAGPTGTLSVRYLLPTPTGVDLLYEGWFERAEGRRLYVGGRLGPRDGGPATAEAEAIVIAFPDA